MWQFKQALSVALLAVAGAVSVSAQTPGKVGWVLKLGAEFGGDQVAKVYFTNGDTQSVNAGQGISFGVGGHYAPVGSKWDFSGTLGYKFVGTAASNSTSHANINLSRTELEFRADRFLQDGWWIGAGPVWHTGIRFNADGLGPNLGFDTASGLTAKVGWKWVAVSFTAMKYKDEFGNSYDANNAGVVLIGRF